MIKFEFLFFVMISDFILFNAMSLSVTNFCRYIFIHQQRYDYGQDTFKSQMEKPREKQCVPCSFVGFVTVRLAASVV